MIVHTKFLGKKAGALGVCYYHILTCHTEYETLDSVRETIYKCGYESVSEISFSVNDSLVLTSDDKLYNWSNGHIRRI